MIEYQTYNVSRETYFTNNQLFISLSTFRSGLKYEDKSKKIKLIGPSNCQ